MTTQSNTIVANITTIDMSLAQVRNSIVILNEIDVGTMNGPALAKFLGVNRVSDRKTGITRALKMISAKIAELVAQEEAMVAEKAELELALAATVTTNLRQDGTRANASAAIAKSWTDAEVRARRLTRQAVCVNGAEFNSTPAAFNELGLPMSKMIKFRLGLKAAGFATFTHEGKDYNFVIAS